MQHVGCTHSPVLLRYAGYPSHSLSASGMASAGLAPDQAIYVKSDSPGKILEAMMSRRQFIGW